MLSLGFFGYCLLSYQQISNYWSPTFIQPGLWLSPTSKYLDKSYVYKYFEGTYNYIGDTTDNLSIILTQSNLEDITLNLPKKILQNSIYSLTDVTENGFVVTDTINMSKDNFLNILREGKGKYKINICLAQYLAEVKDDYDFVCRIEIKKL
jgi:hypothetical protein